MMTAEIKVNGNLIGVLYIHNEGLLERQKVPYVYKYSAIYYEIGDLKMRAVNFSHNRNDGALVCVSKAIGPIIKGSKDV